MTTDAEFLGLTPDDGSGRFRFTVADHLARLDGRLYGGTAIAVSIATSELVSERPATWMTTQFVSTAGAQEQIAVHAEVLESLLEPELALEVEDALYRHAAVLACAVVARPDPKWGETPLAFVELQPGAQVTAEELIAHCKGLLASYKLPREIRFEAIPKTNTGKIQKFVLRQRARQTSAPK